VCTCAASRDMSQSPIHSRTTTTSSTATTTTIAMNIEQREMSMKPNYSCDIKTSELPLHGKREREKMEERERVDINSFNFLYGIKYYYLLFGCEKNA